MIQKDEHGAGWSLLNSDVLAYPACRDLTCEAHDGEHGLIVDQGKLLDMLVALLSSKSAGNVLLVGPGGAGKTALASGLAKRIVHGRCPDALQGRHVLLTSMEDLYALAADATHPWAKQRKILRELFKEIREGGHILFYDNLHNLADFPFSSTALREEVKRGGVTVLAACSTDHFHSFSQKNRGTLDLFRRLDVTAPRPRLMKQILERRLCQSGNYQRADDEALVLDQLRSLAGAYIPYESDPGRSLRILERVLFSKENSDEPFSLSLADVQHAVAETMRIPATMLTAPYRQLFGMEQFLNHRIMGQEESIAKLCRRLVITKSGTSTAPDRPDGVFLFVGPTGVGKTELARALCEYLTGSAENIIRLDMSEYADPANARTLIGQPGGGQETDQRVEMPYLTRVLRETPYSVVLLDEIEKAHLVIRLLFLHAIDTGRMRDNHGNIIYLTNTVFVMTSNAGYSTRKAIVTHPGRLATERAEQEQAAVMQAVKSVLPPEFLGRIDEILFFRQLTPAIMDKFVQQKVEYLERTLGKRIILDKAAKALLREEGFSVEFGARQLNRAVDSMLGYPLALFKSGEEWENAATIHVTRKPGASELEVCGRIRVHKARPKRKPSSRSES